MLHAPLHTCNPLSLTRTHAALLNVRALCAQIYSAEIGLKHVNPVILGFPKDISIDVGVQMCVDVCVNNNKNKVALTVREAARSW